MTTKCATSALTECPLCYAAIVLDDVQKRRARIQAGDGSEAGYAYLAGLCTAALVHIDGKRKLCTIHRPARKRGAR